MVVVFNCVLFYVVYVSTDIVIESPFLRQGCLWFVARSRLRVLLSVGSSLS